MHAVAWVAPSVDRTNCVKPFAVPDTVLFVSLDVPQWFQRPPQLADVLPATVQ